MWIGIIQSAISSPTSCLPFPDAHSVPLLNAEPILNKNHSSKSPMVLCYQKIRTSMELFARARAHTTCEAIKLHGTISMLIHDKVCTVLRGLGLHHIPYTRVIKLPSEKLYCKKETPHNAHKLPKGSCCIALLLLK